MKIEDTGMPEDYIFGPATKIVNYSRMDFLLPPGRTEKYIYYVISGAVGSFVEHKGQEICTGFHTKGHFFSEYVSFISQKVSRTYSKALQPSKIAMVHNDVLQEDYETSIEHQKRGRKISERLFILLNERNIDMLTLSAEERYLKFRDTRPEDVQEIPLKYIASYLGITPASLSRIRKNLNS